jgi:Zn-dependent protease/predicted transcriptional regulator
MLVRNTWRLGSISGIEIAIHPSWLIIYVLFAYGATAAAQMIAADNNTHLSTTNGVILGLIASLVLFASVVAHEFAHALVARRLGIPIGNITLFLFGGVASILREPGTPWDELKMASAGPLASFVIGGLFAALASAVALLHWDWVETLCVFLAAANIVVAVFNLLPAFPSDGGRILRALLWKAIGSQARATGIASTVSAVIAALLVVAGIYLATQHQWRGIWLVFIALFLLQAAIASGRQSRVNLAMERMPVADCMARTLIPVSSAATITELLKLVPAGTQAGYPVVDQGAFVGLVSPRDTGSVPPSMWEHTPVSAIMTAVARLPRLSPQAHASDAFAALTTSGARSLPVFENDELTGVVSEETIMSALRAQQAAKR